VTVPVIDWGDSMQQVISSHEILGSSTKRPWSCLADSNGFDGSRWPASRRPRRRLRPPAAARCTGPQPPARTGRSRQRTARPRSCPPCRARGVGSPRW